ncbi:putative thiamine transporter SLC35F3 [Strongylocentrotus purpuratus]|uniref:Thiamine transporter SLC35F3 n=1 Tax=Strongylocentrotus purpuratus TaxID=7668 RepID=A0A7M7N1Z7_STRPU|nr:putative thiamine transporter SLC35F3 [Strongylocentrotus purpuratus]XP_030829889.1 putative thiamine transporter SLC35F3 [Strongylocentrotus purpuratus]
MDIENQPNTDQQDSAATEAPASEMEGTPVEDTRVEDKVMVVNEEGATPDEGEEAAEKDPMLSPPPEYHLVVGDQAAEVQKEGATKQNGVHPTADSDQDHPPSKPPSTCCLSYGTARKLLIGVTIGLSVAISWVAATQFMKAMYSADNFDAPYFIIWFSTSWMVVCYPIYIIGSLVIFKDQRNAGWAGVKELFKDDQQIYGPRGMTVWTFLKLTGPFCALWMITNYMYAAALKFKSPTDVTAIFVTNTAFIYIFSWIWLEELLILLPARLCSVILSIVGTVLMMAADGFGGGSVIGVLLALGAAIGAALYKVLFKRFLGDATYGQVSLFLTMLALLNLVLLWPIMLGLYYGKRETLDWNNLPWAFLCGTSALGIVFNFLVNFGIALTYPLLISLANVLGIPINAVIDTAFGGVLLAPLKIVGALLIIGGFVIMLLPEAWQVKVACWKEGDPPCRRRGNMQRIPSVELDERAREADNVVRI